MPTVKCCNMLICISSSAAIIFLLSFITPSSQGARLVYHNEDSLPDEIDLMELYLADPSGISVGKRGEESDGKNKKATSGLWFGPRLGRRKRSNSNGLRIRRSDDDFNLAQEEAYLRLIENGPFAVVSLKDGKRRSVNFTPRLGRDSEESLIENLVDAGAGSYGRAPLRPSPQIAGTVQAMSNFTPRLGRLAPPSGDQH